MCSRVGLRVWRVYLRMYTGLTSLIVHYCRSHKRCALAQIKSETRSMDM